jgi:predicted CopG family antitoxin
MTQKTISLPEELYLKLKQKKGNSETFPELLERLLGEEESRENRHKIKDLEGAFGEESDEWEQINKELYNDRLRLPSRKEITFE